MQNFNLDNSFEKTALLAVGVTILSLFIAFAAVQGEPLENYH